MQADQEEFNSFLTRVDDVAALIQSLRSSDPDEVKQAADRAERMVSGRVAEGAVDENVDCVVAAENRECINPRPSADPQTAEQEAFKRQMEADAAERAEKKKKAKAESGVFRQKAIQAFREAKYENALEFYNQAVSLVKDSCLLYTSRAQTYLKLQRPTEAMEDLKLALQLDETSLRAWIHKGKAHQQLREITQAVECFQKAIELHPDQASVVSVYIKDIERSQRRAGMPADEMHY